MGLHGRPVRGGRSCVGGSDAASGIAPPRDSTAVGRALRCLVVREAQPTFVPPMLLTAGGVPDGGALVAKLKWDGCRAQLRYRRAWSDAAHAQRARVRMRFPELLGIADALSERRVILDGELVCLRHDGRPDFARLRRRLAGPGPNPAPALLQIFDVLPISTAARPGLCLTASAGPCSTNSRLTDLPGAPRRASSATSRKPFVANVADLGLEGVVAKRLDSRYTPGRRSPAWIKHKLRQRRAAGGDGSPPTPGWQTPRRWSSPASALTGR